MNDIFESDRETYGTFLAGGEEFSLAAHHIREVVELPSDTIPFSDPTHHVVGMFALREDVIPVVDVRSKLGVTATGSEARRVAVIDCGGHLIGALFDATGEVMEVDASAIRDLQAKPGQPVRAVLHVPDTTRIIRVLDPSSFSGAPIIPVDTVQDATVTAEVEQCQFIVVQVGEFRLAIDMKESFEVHKALAVTASIPYFEHCIGSVTLRDASVGVLDIRAALGIPDSTADACRHVLVHNTQAVIALPVDEVVAVHSALRSDVSQVALFDAPGAGATCSKVVRGKDGDVSVLDVATLFEFCNVDPSCPAGMGKGLLVDQEELVDSKVDEFYLTFEVGGRPFGLDTAQVREIRKFPENLMATPGGDRELRGVMNVRGDVIPVLDLARRYGGEALGDERDQRVIIVEAEGQSIGLLVDRLGEIIHGEDTEDYSAALDTLLRSRSGQQLRDVRRAVRLSDRHERKLLMLLEPAAISARCAGPERGVDVETQHRAQPSPH